jgi:hypothetical protein
MIQYIPSDHPDATRLDALLALDDAAITAHLDALDDASAEQLTSALYARCLGRAQARHAKEGIEKLRAHVGKAVELLRDEALPALERLTTSEHEQVELLLGDVGHDAGAAIDEAWVTLEGASNYLVELWNDLHWRLEQKQWTAKRARKAFSELIEATKS